MIKRKAYSYIRMSTDIQLKGDSKRRQLAASQAYAENHNLELVESIGGKLFEDIGVSAFKGKNTKEGALSVFLNLLENGKIEPDSVLLVESLDRLSRDKLTQALNQFMRILENGIEIITLSDNQKYTQEIINKSPAALFIGLSIMFRANEESEIKSKRLSAAWKNKRDNATTKVVTRTCPAWLKLSEKTGKFEVVKARGKIVKNIFDMCINTCGYGSIAIYLNESNIPVFGTGKLWYTSYIRKIITNRSTIGEFQPHQIVNGKRQKSGEPIADYFPKIIDEQTFLRAQVTVGRRSVIGKGRKGKNVASLFAGITYCGQCGFKMRVRNRGGVSPSSKYLVCNNKIEGGGCQMYDWNMADFEGMMFRHLREVNFEELIDNHIDDKKVSLDDQVGALRSKLKSNDEAITEAMNYALSSKLSKEMKQRFEDKIIQIDLDSKETKQEIDELLKLKEEQEESQKIFSTTALKQLLEQIDANKDDYMFRSTVNQFLIKLIEKVELCESSEPFAPWDYDENDAVVKAFRLTFKIRGKRTLDKIVNDPEFEQFNRQYNRTIKIKYRSGAERILYCGSDASFNFDNGLKVAA